jgi:hypothetical protein
MHTEIHWEIFSFPYFIPFIPWLPSLPHPLKLCTIHQVTHTHIQTWHLCKHVKMHSHTNKTHSSSVINHLPTHTHTNLWTISLRNQTMFVKMETGALLKKLMYCRRYTYSSDKLTSPVWKLCLRSCNFSPSWFSGTFQVAYSKAKVKKNTGDEAFPRFSSLQTGKLSDKYILIVISAS